MDHEARIARLERLVAQLSRQQGQPISFARSTATPIDTGVVQTIQGQFDALSLRDGMPVLYHYGYTAAPPIGCDKIVAHLGGDRSKAVVIATGHQTYRYKNLATGEVALYDMFGNVVHLEAAGNVDISAPSSVILRDSTSACVATLTPHSLVVTAPAEVELNTPAVRCTGNLAVAAGASGTFTSVTGQVITVQDGIVTNIY